METNFEVIVGKDKVVLSTESQSEAFQRAKFERNILNNPIHTRIRVVLNDNETIYDQVVVIKSSKKLNHVKTNSEKYSQKGTLKLQLVD